MGAACDNHGTQKKETISKIHKIRLDCGALVDVLVRTGHHRKADLIDFWMRRLRRVG